MTALKDFLHSCRVAYEKPILVWGYKHYEVSKLKMSSSFLEMNPGPDRKSGELGFTKQPLDNGYHTVSYEKPYWVLWADRKYHGRYPDSSRVAVIQNDTVDIIKNIGPDQAYRS